MMPNIKRSSTGTRKAKMKLLLESNYNRQLKFTFRSLTDFVCFNKTPKRSQLLPWKTTNSQWLSL